MHAKSLGTIVIFNKCLFRIMFVEMNAVPRRARKYLAVP